MFTDLSLCPSCFCGCGFVLAPSPAPSLDQHTRHHPSHVTRIVLQQFPFFSSNSSIILPFHWIIPITMQICCYFSSLGNIFFLRHHVSLWQLPCLFPSPYSKIRRNRCWWLTFSHFSVKPVRIFYLQLYQNCSSQGPQTSKFPNQRTCFGLQLKFDPSVAFDTIIHSPVHEILYLTSWTKSSSEFPLIFSIVFCFCFCFLTSSSSTP